MYKNIVVPLDGSTFGEHALPMALGIAKRSNAKLVLAHVHVPLAPLYLEGAGYFEDDVEAHFKEERMAYLEKALQRVRESGVPASIELLEGPVSATLADFAKTTGADLVVMTTHGRNPMSRFWLGSVTDKMLRHCAVPMLLVHPGEGEPDLKADVSIEKLMIALDGTEFAERVVSPAEELAKLMHAEVSLFRAVEFLWPSPYPDEYIHMGAAVQSVMTKVEGMQSQVLEAAEGYLAKIAEPLREHGLTVETHVSARDYPAEAVLEGAKEFGCDAIAIETHGRHGLSRMFLGSIADKIIRGTTLPVLVHRPEPIE